MNFNIVNKSKKEDEQKDEEIMDEDEMEFEQEDDDDDDDDGKILEADAKKKMIRFMGLIIGGFIILILILYLFSLMNQKTYSFEKIEKILEDAAASYFKDNPSSLPKNDGDIVEIDSTNLVAAGKMKDLSYYTKKGVICTGLVRVEKSADEYLYLPYLNCGDSYSSLELYKKIQEDNPTVSSGYGLYSMKGEYVFRGENIANYVKLDNSLWRVVKINNNNNVVMILEKGLTYTQYWDNRYNEESKYDSGINQYSSSRIKEFLDKIYTSPDSKKGEEILSTHDKARLASIDVCVGKRNNETEVKDNSLDCKEKYRNQKIGLLSLSDFLLASTDANCKSPLTRSCKNYNYLVVSYNWWLSTAFSENTFGVYQINSGGVAKPVYANNYAFVRPVIALSNAVKYSSGTGTEKDPYIIK